MEKIEQMRQQAELMRKAAAVRTTGGHRTNRLLLELAEQLTRRAEKLERRLAPAG
jgi:hypothetical protein